MIGGWDICVKIALKLMSLDLIDDKSTLVQVMACCRQATSHYLSQYWPRSMSPYGVTRPQWVKVSQMPRNLSVWWNAYSRYNKEIQSIFLAYYERSICDWWIPWGHRGLVCDVESFSMSQPHHGSMCYFHTIKHLSPAKIMVFFFY